MPGTADNAVPISDPAATTYYLDADGDDHGSGTFRLVRACAPVAGYSAARVNDSMLAGRWSQGGRSTPLDLRQQFDPQKFAAFLRTHSDPNGAELPARCAYAALPV